VVFAQAAFISPTGAPILPLKAEAKDTGVPRNRLLMIPIDALGPDGQYPQKRADWQVARQYGRSRQVQITVSGFRDRVGALVWAITELMIAPMRSFGIFELYIGGLPAVTGDQDGHN
jgi:prophage tail gpP-like protein